MISIRRWLGHDEKFFDLLECSARQADSSVHQLVELLEKLQQDEKPENLEAWIFTLPATGLLGYCLVRFTAML
jgi:hypothetical protein